MPKQRWLLLNLLLAPLFLYLCWAAGKPLYAAYLAFYFEKNLHNSMVLVGNWFMRNQQDTGDFPYEIDLELNQVLDDYNIVRQAGSLYSLCQLYKQTRDPKLKTTIDGSIDFFHSHAKTQEPEESIAIVYEGVQKSNASALLLVALVEYLEVHPDDTEVETFASQLATFLVTTQLPSGGFMYQPNISQAESDYNNAETFYALVRYYRLTQDDTLKPVIDKIVDYVYTTYPPDVFNGSYFSWAMAAFAYLYDMTPKTEYWQYMQAYTNTFFGSMGNTMNNSTQQYQSGWSVMLEGLAHTIWIAKTENPEYSNNATVFMKRHLAKIMALQINGPTSLDQYRLAEPYTGAICYDTSCKTIRIDTTHHALSAMYLYSQFVH